MNKKHKKCKEGKNETMEENNIDRNRLETDLLRTSGIYESVLAKVKKESEVDSTEKSIEPVKKSIFQKIISFFKRDKANKDKENSEVLELQNKYKAKKVILSDLSDEQIEKLIFLYNKQIDELNKNNIEDKK